MSNNKHHDGDPAAEYKPVLLVTFRGGVLFVAIIITLAVAIGTKNTVAGALVTVQWIFLMLFNERSETRWERIPKLFSRRAR